MTQISNDGPTFPLTAGSPDEAKAEPDITRRAPTNWRQRHSTHVADKPITGLRPENDSVS